MTLTFCSASVLVLALRLSLLVRRALAVINAEHASRAGITKSHSSRFPFEREACFWRSVPEAPWSGATELSNCLFIESSRILSSQVLRFFVTTHHCENHWNKKERCDGGKQQPANYRTAEWRILLPSLTEPQGHRHHADDHRESGHHHRPQPRGAGLKGRSKGILGLAKPFVRKRDDQ